MTEHELKELEFESFLIKLRVNSFYPPNTIELIEQRTEIKRKIKNEKLRIKRELKLKRILNEPMGTN